MSNGRLPSRDTRSPVVYREAYLFGGNTRYVAWRGVPVNSSGCYAHGPRIPRPSHAPHSFVWSQDVCFQGPVVRVDHDVEQRPQTSICHQMADLWEGFVKKL